MPIELLIQRLPRSSMTLGDIVDVKPNGWTWNQHETVGRVVRTVPGDMAQWQDKAAPIIDEAARSMLGKRRFKMGRAFARPARPPRPATPGQPERPGRPALPADTQDTLYDMSSNEQDDLELDEDGLV